jgi:hypothetical protein
LPGCLADGLGFGQEGRLFASVDAGLALGAALQQSAASWLE